MQLIPAVLTDSKADLLHKASFLEGKSSWMQIDFVDQAFGRKQSLEPNKIKHWPSLRLQIECHLMVANPFGWVRDCDQFLPHRLVPQVEAVESQIEFVERVVAEGMEVGFAINLSTPLERLQKEAVFSSRVILILAVSAGESGQQFHPEVAVKIRELQDWRRRLGANFQIGIDGGVKPENFDFLRRQGVDLAYLNSALWQADDWARRWQELQQLAKG